MYKFKVTFAIAASKGFCEIRRLEVEAPDEGAALLRAAMLLNDEGQDRWSLKEITRVQAN